MVKKTAARTGMVKKGEDKKTSLHTIQEIPVNMHESDMERAKKGNFNPL